MPESRSESVSPTPDSLPSPPITARKNLGKFRVLGVLGQGGNGVVYRAFDTVLNRVVALKVLSRRHTDDSVAVERFLREARAAAGINHPHVVIVYDVEQLGNEFLLVMEHVPGGSIDRLLEKRERLPWTEATRIVRDACRGLVAAHAVGLIHRDIKPGNILLADDAVAKLADFGLARPNLNREGALTQPGQVVGTPLYMSPEQCRNEELDERSDIYSLGATYFTLLTGRPPFEGDGMALFIAHCVRSVPDPRTLAPDVPEACAALVRKAMAKEPADRYPNAQELRAALDLALSGEVFDPRRLGDLAPSAAYEAPTLPASIPFSARSATRRKWLAMATLGLVVLGSSLAFFLGRKGEGGGRENHDRHKNFTAIWPQTPLVVGGTVESIVVSHAPDSPVTAWVEVFHNQKSRLTLWNWQRGEVQHERDLPFAVHDLALAPDGALLALAPNGGGKVQVWDTTSGVSKELPPLMATFRVAAFAPDSRTLAVGVDGHARKTNVQLFDVVKGKRLPLEVEPAQSPALVAAMAFSADGRTLALALRDGRTLLIETADWKIRKTVRVSSGYAYALAFSPDSSVLVGGVAGPKAEPIVQMWNTGSGEEVGTLRGHKKEVFSVAFSPNGQLLASADTAHIRLWDVARKGPVGEPLAHVHNVVRALVFSPNGKALFSGGFDGTIRRWEVDSPLAP